MNKAEDLAEKVYPQGDIYIFGDASIACQAAYVKGYHQAEKDLHKSIYKAGVLDGFEDAVEGQYEKGYKQAEKDLELTWEDIDIILDITDIIANDDAMEESLKTMSQEEYCKEVLKRFKKQKNESKNLEH